MRLTLELAKKYVSYRERFLSGSNGLYLGFPSSNNSDNCQDNSGHMYGSDPCQDNAGRQYNKNDYVPFMITTGDGSIKTGAYLLASELVVQPTANPLELENSSIKELHFGDNTVYSSVALVNFVAEYAVTGLPSSLELALNILKSFQRLGSIQRGYREKGSSPYGFVLRADSHDWSDPNENICTFNNGTGPASDWLAPSFDQYAAILACFRFVKTLVEEIPADLKHIDLRNEFLDIISERTRRIIDYLAFQTTYMIRWEAGGKVRQPPDDRGPYCHAAAYPFARIAAKILIGNSSDYGNFLGELDLAIIRDITELLIEQMVKGLHKISDFLRDYFVEYSQDVIMTGEWELISKFFDLVADVLDAFDKQVLGPVTQHIIDPIISQIRQWGGNPATVAVNEFLSQQFYDLFVAGVLLDISDGPFFEDSELRLSLRRLLEWIGHVDIPDSIPIDLQFDFEPKKPSWWNEDIFGKWPTPKWHFPVAKFEIPMSRLFDVTIPIPLTGLLRTLASLVQGKPYLRFLAYNLLVSSETINEVPNVDARGVAVKYDNAWFMALAHRFCGVGIGEPGVKEILNILESAPDTFPKASGAGHWNQDFRWIRTVQDKDSPTIYSGLDFMAPLMVACSNPVDIMANRDILVDALSSKIQEEYTMGPFRLPFQGPIKGKKIFERHEGGTQSDKIVEIAVVFDRAVGNAKMVITIPKLAGGTEDVSFDQRDNCSKVVAAPLTNFGIEIKEASSDAKGYILISTGE